MRRIVILVGIAGLLVGTSVGCQRSASMSDERSAPADKPSTKPMETPSGTGSGSGSIAPGSGSTNASGSGPEYAKDVATICNVESLAGIEGLPPGDEIVPIANYLGSHVITREGRQFLAKVQPLVGEPKAVALEGEARRVGLSGCALAARWRQ